MNKKYLILIPLSVIWLAVCSYIAYQGQFPLSEQLNPDLLGNTTNRPIDYSYPTSDILQACFIYTIWMLSYAFLFCSKYAIKHPLISYALCSILPILLPLLSFVWANDVPQYIAALIIVIWATSLFHFLLLPILLPIYRKYIYPNTPISQ